MADLFTGFDTVDHPVGQGVVHARVGGRGAPVLLLHGFPQTHAMWHRVAPRLAEKNTVVAADIRGYGSSRGGGEFTFRAMAGDLILLMDELGYERFHVVGHDRGARVAHRMAFDHPHRVASVALLDILPTLDVWELMDAWLVRRYYHWAFLAQPGGLPERLISNDPIFFLHHTLRGLSGSLVVFDPAALQEYERAAQRPEVVAAWCADYRSAAGEDLDHDRADLSRTLDIPALVLWGANGVVGAKCDPLQRWRKHFPKATGASVAAGHFLAEEAPDTVFGYLSEHLAANLAGDGV
ncbi:alpha/beta hydrolase [Mycobacterium sp. SM1]|uniref:alpha/beta fold hydrolase n=1 Tax=Mycobacterium sp. SM1 TaxID=2816243 RepID=UPI0027DC97EF|nr:alpha/beta hydrolase [Mycobacterium sp. SM1]